MSEVDRFFDSNVLLYLTSADITKAQSVETLVEEGGVVSVQVLNECAAVARRKFAMDWAEIAQMLQAVRAACRVDPISLTTHDLGFGIARRFGFRIYDSMIVASALEAGCATLYSEDLQHGQRIGPLSIRNPFAS